MRPQRDLSRSPLFQVMFVLQNAPQPPLRLRDLEISMLPLPPLAAKLDLTLFMWETSAGLEGSFEYATDLFEEARLVRLATHFHELREGSGVERDKSIS